MNKSTNYYFNQSLNFVEKQSYAQLSQNYSVALHQAGQGMCQNMTILGLGQILIPSYPEGGINGASVQGLKVGSVIPPGQHETLSNEKLDTVLEEMLAEDHTKRVWDSTRHFRERAGPRKGLGMPEPLLDLLGKCHRCHHTRR